MPLPFRNPIGGDGDPVEEDSWEPPSYAKEVKPSDISGEAWEPPEYAKEVKAKEKPKESLASRATSFGKRVLENVVEKPIKDMASRASDVIEKAKSPVKSNDYGYGPRWDEKSQSYSGSPKGLGYLGPLRNKSGQTQSEFSRDDEINGKSTSYPLIVPTLSKDEVKTLLNSKEGDKFPNSIEKKAKEHAKMRIDSGKDPFAQTGEQRLDIHPDLERNPTPELKDKSEERKDTTAVGFDQNKWSDVASKFPEKWHGIPIRQPAAFMGSLAGTALENLSDPANIAAMGAGIGFKGSEHIPIRERPAGGFTRSKEIPYSNEELPKARKLLAASPDYISGERGIAENRPYSRDSNAPYSIQQPHGGTLAPSEAGQINKVPPEIAAQYGLEAGTKAEDLPIREPRLSPEEAVKPLVNPFEKAPAEESQVRQPSAKFAFDWPEVGKQYDVVNPSGSTGGFHKSTVGEARLKELGIDVPSSQADRNAAHIAESAADKPTKFGKADEWKPPSYAKEVEARPDITEGFGGAGHPDDPNYTNNVLKSAGSGDAGLAVEDKEGFKHVVYRNREGNPVAAAKLVTGPDGKTLVSDLAADKSRGLLTGRAMKAIGDKLKELGATESSGTLSSDAENFIKGMKDSAEKTPTPEDVTMMHGGIGGPINAPKTPSTGPYGPVLDKLFTSLEESKGLTDVQSSMYKTEQAKRFAAYSDPTLRGGGVEGAAKRLSKLKGQYEKIEPLYGKLQLNEQESKSLFDAVDNAKISTPEKARGSVALFKLLNGTEVPQRNELALLDEVFGNNFAERITQTHGGFGATGLNIAKAANTMKSMENAISIAAPLRHGAGLMWRKEFYPAFYDMFKFFGNKEYYNSAMRAITEKPNYMLGRESGLFIAKQGSLMNSEEEFLNSYVGDLPKFSGIPQMVGASQRGYVGFLNKLRSDTFDGMVKRMRELGFETHTQVGDEIIPTKETKAIARFINNATGRGSLDMKIPFTQHVVELNKMTNELNALLWSPRMISSRINMLANPKIYMDLPKGMRREGIKSLLGIASMSLVVNGLATVAGATVGTNILSTDFMKSRFKGGKVVDPNAGLQQYVVGAARFLAGKTDSSTPTNRLEIAGRFLANKESPAASLAHTIFTAKKFTGKSDDPATAGNFINQYNQKTSIQSEIGKRFLPIFVQDLQELMTSEPKWSEDIGLTAIMTGASLTGMSQQYPEKKKGKLRLGSMRLH